MIDTLVLLKAMVDENNCDNDMKLLQYLELAGSKIISKAYPYDDNVTEVPNRYKYLQCEIAAYLWNKRGAEGQTSHSENGISRSYESASVPASMLSEIVPNCGVIGG